jgi:hypothetical protein
MTPQQAITQLTHIEQQLKSELRSAHALTLITMRTTARKLSSGPYTLKELAKMGHPYAVRHGGKRKAKAANAPYLAPQIVNAQSGAFRRDWISTLGSFGDDGNLKSTLENDNPVAGYLDAGTKVMVRRPIKEEIMKRTAPQYRRNVEMAISEAIQ